MQRRKLVAAAVTAIATMGAATVGLVQANSASAATLSNNWYASAPYLMPLDNNPPDPITVMNATGQKAFQLAFILSGGGCTPAWDGHASVSGDTQVAALINRIRNNGGDVSVSIGGYGGTKLGQTCGSPQATAAAYQQVVTKYGLKAIDFDLEEPEYENDAAIANELGAAQILQRNNPGLYISVTTAGTGAGTGWFGQQMLNRAKSLGFTPDNFSIMPFDGGFNGAAAQINALEAFHGILMNTFGWDSATAYAREGASLMNGRSDAAEYFPQSAFQQVLDYATGHHLARYTFWSVNRDRECNPPDNQQTSGTCSSVAQTPWEFTKFTARFAGATPPQNPPPTNPPPGGGTCDAPAWDATKVYTGGAVVSYSGHKYTAKWWTQGDRPDLNTGDGKPWADNGACGGGGNPNPPPTTSPPGGGDPNPPPTTNPPPPNSGSWEPNHPYRVGDVVSYSGRSYRCLQAHTSLVGWEPPNVPALWQAL
jgi:chitinase